MVVGRRLGRWREGEGELSVMWEERGKAGGDVGREGEGRWRWH